MGYGVILQAGFHILGLLNKEHVETAWSKLTTYCLEGTCDLEVSTDRHVDVAGKVVVMVQEEGADIDAGAKDGGEPGTVIGVEDPWAGLHELLQPEWAGDVLEVMILGVEAVLCKGSLH